MHRLQTKRRGPWAGREPSTIKDHAAEGRLFLRRVLWAVFLLALPILALAVRLLYLQVVEHEHYTTLSRDNRVKILPIPPTRGLIYDRHGALLAGNMPSYRLEITSEQVKDMAATLQDLGALVELTEGDLARFHRLRTRMRRFQGVPLRFHLSEEEVARFSVNRHRFPGVDIVAVLSRHYPFAEHAAHAVGYVGRIDEKELQRLDPANYSGTSHTGKSGVERSHEEVLHGQVGVQQVETNAQGRLLRVLGKTSPTPGRNLHLTLDMGLQIAAERALGEFTGSVVAIEPATGEVLALVSKPGFDPNPFVNGIEVQDYAALQRDPNQPLYNRALRGQYPPGSTVKPFMGLAGLEHGLISPTQSVWCPGYYRLPGSEHRFRDWRKEGHGRLDLNRAVVESCDVYFYDLANNLGIDRMHDFMSRFGFGARTGIDIGGELPGLMPSRQWKRNARGQPWFPGETLIAGIGQGFVLSTPLQLANATAALAMRGQRIAPRMVGAVADPNTGELEAREATLLESVPVIDSAHWEHTVASMIESVHGARGTARSSGAGAPYRIAGKTGTAQVFGIRQDATYVASEVPEKLRDHALFVAFAPAEQPRIALAVIVENGGSGGGVAAPIARTILDYYLLGERQ
jgi:penicillin-binding protein 2